MSPVITPEHGRLFAKAVLSSTAKPYKSKKLNKADFKFVYNCLDEVIGDSSAFEVNEDDTEPIHERLFRHLATLIDRQSSLQARDLPFRLARTYALMGVLPQEYAKPLKQSWGEHYLDISEVLKSHIGCNSRSMLLIGLHVISLVKERFQFLNRYLDKLKSAQRKTSSRDKQRFLIELLFEKAADPKSFQFTESELIDAAKPFPPQEVQAFLATIARSTQELREEREARPERYDLGALANQLSPLERYPIIRINKSSEQEPNYIAPNLHFLDRLIPTLPHFAILDLTDENLRKRYLDMRGLIHEYFIRNLVERHLPDLNVIPEITYDVSGQEWKGPDLTLVDVENDCIILVEAKAKRLQLKTRLESSLDPLSEDLSKVLKALDRLPQKIEHLKKGLGDYKTHESVLKKGFGKKPIAVLVMGDDLTHLSELARLYVQKSPDHFLQHYEIPYCVMGLEDFENAIDIAASNPISLYDLLHEYVDDVESALQVGSHGFGRAAYFRGRSFRRGRFLQEVGDALFSG